MTKVIIDIDSAEAREYIAYLLWNADHGSKPGARSDKKMWDQYKDSADEFLEHLVVPVHTTVYGEVAPGETEMTRVAYRTKYAGIETVKE